MIWGMERPNTVAGLIEKRRELVARLKLARDETRTLTCGIDAIDVVLKLFAPEVDGRTAKPMRLPIPHAAAKGEMQSIAFELLRERSAITSRMLAERFCEKRGLQLDDISFQRIRYRASSTMSNLRRKGLVRQIGRKGTDMQWAICDGPGAWHAGVGGRSFPVV
jgi:hypothetical protein